MPVVILKQGARCLIPDTKLAGLVAHLPVIISRALDVDSDPSARLFPEDIEVWHLPPSSLDRNAKSMTLLILAHGYEKRVANLEERKNIIVAGVRKILGESDEKVGWVWIFTGFTVFGKF